MAIRNGVTRNIMLLVFSALVSIGCSRPGNSRATGTTSANLDPDFSLDLLSAEFNNNSNYYVEVSVYPRINRGTDRDSRTTANSFNVMVPPKTVSGGRAYVYLPRHTTIPDGFKIYQVDVSSTDSRATVAAAELCSGGRGVKFKVGWSDRDADQPTNQDGKSFTRTVSGLTVTVNTPPPDEAGLLAKAKKELGALAIKTVTWERDTDGLKFTRDCIATAGTVPHFVSGNLTYGDSVLLYGPGSTIRGLTLSGGGKDVKIQCGQEAIQGQLLATLDGTNSDATLNDGTEEPLDPGSDFNAWITNDGDNMAPDPGDAEVCTEGDDACGCQASEY